MTMTDAQDKTLKTLQTAARAAGLFMETPFLHEGDAGSGEWYPFSVFVYEQDNGLPTTKLGQVVIRPAGQFTVSGSLIERLNIGKNPQLHRLQ